ncbi:MAG: ribonuclease P protein component 1 [Candidatus Heimdallarchaeota archaeon]|nr:ribonuclease P protein component 1 [Candidatus Heimdallarchaeota archaeon]MCK5158709.1 ribonuclease P protein component 1 [Candidatus Heimdallarchaeota archaeon]MCK5298133.1 ribonuclease P protein component 1 [Candidatus Heimdallarchaeota archaeon]
MVSLNPITPENIHRHELIGLKIEIIQSTDKQMMGMNGLVVDETKNLLTIDSSKNDSNRVRIPKKDCVFRFSLPSGEQVDVDGRLLKLKPENRLKNIMRKRW